MEKFYSIVRGLGLKRGPQRWLGGVCGGIAEKLNVEKVPTIHGTNRWTAASVRKAFVS